MTSGVPTQPRTHTVLLYSHDRRIRDRMRLAIGPRPDRDMKVRYLEADTHERVVSLVDDDGIDLVLLDGEAWPAGGMGIARQLRDEVPDCPPTCVVLARSADRWLAAWSGADAVLVHPLDPVQTAATVANLLRARMKAVPTTR